MSVELFVVASAVEEGSLKKLFQAGIQRSDFVMCEEEFDWLLSQTENKRAINWRRFQQAFPDFERLISNERLQDLCEELKSEVAYQQLHSAIRQVADDLTPDNTVDQADFLREVIADVLRVHTSASDLLLTSDYKKHLSEIRNLMLLREQGVPPGIPTGIKTLDNHWGGLQAGRAAVVLGRPGDAKSMLICKFAVSGFLDARRVGVFSPEMNEHEHRTRVATLMTADKRVQEELGVQKSFRNRALLDGTGFNLKTYKRFWEWTDSQKGEIALFTQKYRRQKLTPSFIESRIDDLGLELIIIDPIYKLKSESRKLTGWERLQQLTDDLCDIAEIHNIPIVITNQAHRQQGNRGDAPHKDNSFGGDAPVQEADHLIGVKHIYDERKMILRCTKNRFGADFRVDLRFLPNIGILEDVSYREHGYYNGSDDGSDGDVVKRAVEELEREMEHERR
jgi:replicative DNA helicase